MKYSCSLTDAMLSREERDLFSACLAEHGVDQAVWEVFTRVMGVSSRVTQPRVLRVYHDGRLAGAAFLVRCRAWGRALFANPLLHRPIDFIGLPSHIWIRVGYCAEGVANPGFVAPGHAYGDVVTAMVDYLRNHTLGTIITDRMDNLELHPGAVRFGYVNDGAVDVSGFRDVQDYVDTHHNIKRKIKWFVNKGGRIEIVHGGMDESRTALFKRFLNATVTRSLVYSPFQDRFVDIVARTCACHSDSMVHFLAHMNGSVLGYHSFLRTGCGLRMLHGAFDRDRKTTHHAYENLIIETVRYALDRGLRCVYFGPIMNETKRRMMNWVEPSALYFYSNNPIIRSVIPPLFPHTRMQRNELLRFGR